MKPQIQCTQNQPTNQRTNERASNRHIITTTPEIKEYACHFIYMIFSQFHCNTIPAYFLCVMLLNQKKSFSSGASSSIQFSFFLSVSSLVKFITEFQVESKQTCVEPICLIQNAVIVDESISYSAFCSLHLSINARV